MELRNNNQIQEVRFSQLEDRFEYYRQKTLDCDLEIWGIERRSDENLDLVVQDLCASLDTEITENSIKDIYRKMANPEDTTASIVVGLHRKALRDRILQKGIHSSVLKSSSKEIQKDEKLININENISSY